MDRPPLLAILRGLGRLLLLLAVILLLAAAAWQGASLLGRDGQALAPVVGQYYAGQPWMATPTPTPSPTQSPTPPNTPTPVPTPSPTATLLPVEPAAAELRPTPASHLLDVARKHGIDPAGSYIIVEQNMQRMTIVEAGRVLRALAISSGDPDRGWYTPAWSGVVGEFWGSFSANGVWADDAWYLFQAGGSILIHSLPYTLEPDGGKRYQGRDELGIFPASRGCIRIAPEEARWFTEWGPAGVPVVVLPWNSGAGRAG